MSRIAAGNTPRVAVFSVFMWLCAGLTMTLASAQAASSDASAQPVANEDSQMQSHMHHHHSAAPQYSRSLINYAVPDVKLLRSDGKSVILSDELADSRPVVLSFIYTSCTTVCPMTSATLGEMLERLGPARESVHVVSISIDPEYDTPQRLRAYSARFGAASEWQYYTGTLAASIRAQRAFDVYRGDKMDHAPVTLLRARPGEAWVRIDGFATADQLLAELPAFDHQVSLH